MNEPRPASPEFPVGADLPPDDVSRRELLELIGAGAAGAALAGCIQSPTESVLPYTRHPGTVVPGLPLFYATSMVLDGYATGLLVRSREGRPVKIEGNPDHPASLGGSGAIEQASILGLYDSRRARHLRLGDRVAAWGELRRRLVAAATVNGGSRSRQGAGLAFLLDPSSSPLRARLLAQIAERYPESRVFVHAPTAPLDASRASRAVLGARLDPQYDFRAAERVLAVGSDFVSEGPFHLRYARHFAATRRLVRPSDPMSRLYAVDTHPTPTSSLADERLRARPSEQGRFLAAVARELGARSPALDRAASGLTERQTAVAIAAARDLARHPGRSLVVAGPRLGAPAHALAHWMNERLDNIGRTLWYTEPALGAGGSPGSDLAELSREIDRGAVSTLVIAGVNPVATAPGDVPFAKLLARVAETVYLAPYEDETAGRCRWVVAAAHYLESWGDARAYDGTVSLVQPLIAPLFGGHTSEELLAIFARDDDKSAHDLLREFWTGGIDPGEQLDREKSLAWERALERGFLPGTAFARRAPRVSLDAVLQLAEELAPDGADGGAGELELELRSDLRVHDGHLAGNLWLQELPDPVSQLTWGNAVLLSPATATAAGLESGALVEISVQGRSVRGPVLVLPGHADGAATVELGHGRSSVNEPAASYGFDAYPLRSAGEPYVARGAVLRRLASAETDGAERARHRLASTQAHWRLEGRDDDIVLRRTLEEWRAAPQIAADQRQPQPMFYRFEPDLGAASHARDQWAMTIDLSACTGCNACTAACQVENNIPIVGKEGVLKGREMHWIRVDRYLDGPDADPAVIHQPMLCQHCERAPCEYVCPVFATAHSADGLNDMVYNRCVGTRFCSNNCPYKVRRFNWFDYSRETDEVGALAWNPEVTVRERGVMEKCTYCVQRIRRAQIQAQIENDRPLSDGEVIPACAQACPSRAIVFGSLTDPESAVSRSRANPRSFSVLHELATVPRTRYLARIDNPHPELGGAVSPDVERPPQPSAARRRNDREASG